MQKYYFLVMRIAYAKWLETLPESFKNFFKIIYT